VDEFGDQSYQDPILEMGRMLDENHQRELMAFESEARIEHDEELQEFSGAKTADTAASQVFRDTRERMNETEIEGLAVSSPCRRDVGMAVDIV